MTCFVTRNIISMVKDIDLISCNYFDYSIDLEEPTNHVEVSHEGHGRTCTINVAGPSIPAKKEYVQP